jgi:hypothetical protein
MINSKKSLIMIGTLVRIIAALAVIFLVIIPACNKIRSVFYDKDKQFVSEFDKLVREINTMSEGGKFYLLGMKDDSAIVGFSMDGDFECYNCGKQYQHTETPYELRMIFKRPLEDECNGNACVCICLGIDFDDVKINHNGNDIDVKAGACDLLTCRKISDNTISFDSPVELPRQVISTGVAGRKVYMGKWENGFIFSRDVSILDGLMNFDENNLQLFIQKKQGTIGICNSDMITHNRDNYGSGSADYNECIQP